ncbi:MAG: MaoC/PaaZ C-terminal domain-containing protein [bacterium]|nr:MaoC/PaaZ C-terminal domain-containing protein [bacterium]MDE0287402.1 MaoC/PaaZ C-terminal domain-containing protein [bacterium]MDE0438822.1 MaoC/PaaZ C-terminal domain-containing protein [bacterium]
MTGTVDIGPEAATLYRLTGDKHPVHSDPVAAARVGLDRPILHGPATIDGHDSPGSGGLRGRAPG